MAEELIGGNIFPGKILIEKFDYRVRESGIIIPDTNNDVSMATVVMSGGSISPEKPDIKVGSKVIINPLAANKNNLVVLKDKEYHVINITDVLFIFND